MAFNEALAVESVALAIGGRNDGGKGEGAHEGRPYGGRGWVPASARTTERDGRWGKGMGPRIREDNGGGRVVREPSLRGWGAWKKERGGKGVRGSLLLEGLGGILLS